MTSTKAPAHDTLVYRLSQILFKLNQGEALEPRALAQEFGVALRTIQRDLNVRLSSLPLQKNGPRYAMDLAFLGKFQLRDLQRFTSLAGVHGLFPDLTDQFLRDVSDTRSPSSIEVRGHNYEDLRGLEAQFKDLENAIAKQFYIRFNYRKSDGTEKYVEDAKPYKLLNQKGIWYLIAMVDTNLKTYAFTRVSGVWMSDDHFALDPAVEAELATNDSIWLGDQKTDVKIRVSAAVATFFQRRKLIPNQFIEKVSTDGSLVIRATVSHANQVLPIVRYWIPHLRIEQPAQWQRDLEEALKEYVTCTIS